MSETMSNLFGRARNDTTTIDTEAIDVTEDTEDTDTAADDVEDTESDDTEAVEVEARPAAGVRGNTTVGDEVVSKVVNMVARKADGVYRLDDEDTSVTVDADIAMIRIALVVEYEHAVKALAEQVRTDVIGAVEQFLGLDVAAVDIHVSDIHYPEAVA